MEELETEIGGILINGVDIIKFNTALLLRPGPQLSRVQRRAARMNSK
jgi:hypothetical protein